MKFILQMTREKETPGTVRFQESEDKTRPPVLKTLYIQKWAAGEAQEITVTIADGKGE
jgi:hypothetical protein